MRKLLFILSCLNISLVSYSQTIEDVNKNVDQQFIDFCDKHEGLTFYFDEYIWLGCIIQSEKIITQKTIKDIIKVIAPYHTEFNDEFMYHFVKRYHPNCSSKFFVNVDTCIVFEIDGVFYIDLIDNHRIKLSYEIQSFDVMLYDKEGNSVGRPPSIASERKLGRTISGCSISASLAYPFCRYKPENLKYVQYYLLTDKIPEAYNFNCQSDLFIKFHNKFFEWAKSVERSIVNKTSKHSVQEL